MSIRLVACDIDGTLLHGQETALSPAVIAQIRRLSQKGIRFCPTSGRQYTSLRQLFAPLTGQLYFLCENGSILYGPGDPGKILYRSVLDWQMAMELSREILEEPNCEVMISGADMSYLCPRQTDVIEHLQAFIKNRITLLQTPEQTPEAIIKVSAFCRDGAVNHLDSLLARWKDRLQAAVAGEVWLDFTVANKGSGLRELCSQLGIAMEEVMAIGDNFNDLPMLQQVGHPVLMANAVPELRAQFPRQCQRVEDILAELL